ncbi:MAG: hypothetical protein ACLUNG_11980 [[Clostridium] leptum]
MFQVFGIRRNYLKAVLGDSFLPRVDDALRHHYFILYVSGAELCHRRVPRYSAVQKNPFYVALYIALFPQLVAGPIVRYSTVAEEIRNRVHSWELLSEEPADSFRAWQKAAFGQYVCGGGG